MVARRAQMQAAPSQASSNLWATDPHEYGPGRIHILNRENPSKTLCGKWLRAMPGKYVSGVDATCRICLGSFENRKHRRAQQEEWRKEGERRSRERAQQSQEWWRSYNSYLRTPEWFEKRDAVMRRAGGVCEGCGKQPAIQVHHLSYEHVKLVPGRGLVCTELLWELRAVCKACHERIHHE